MTWSEEGEGGEEGGGCGAVDDAGAVAGEVVGGGDAASVGCGGGDAYGSDRFFGGASSWACDSGCGDGERCAGGGDGSACHLFDDGDAYGSVGFECCGINAEEAGLDVVAVGDNATADDGGCSGDGCDGAGDVSTGAAFGCGKGQAAVGETLEKELSGCEVAFAEEEVAALGDETP